MGERNGKKIFGFDYGNLPATIITLDLLDETIILTTSSGTKGLIHARDAEERIIASFSNISNVISYLKEKQPTVVSLIPMGLNAESPAIEDTVCAEIIRKRLSHEKIDTTGYFSIIEDCLGMKRLKKLGQQADIYYCLQPDLFPIIPYYDKKRKAIDKKEL